MKKIFNFILGACFYISMMAVQANEKFEILPDLPEPLAYAVQPVQAASVSGSTDVALAQAQTIGNEPNIISVIISLIFVVLLIYLTGIIYAKLNKVGYKTLKKQNGEFLRSQVSVLSTTPLGSNKTLHVIELDSKRFLIGASSGNIQLIKDLGSYKDGDVSEISCSNIEIPNIRIPKIEIPKIEIPSLDFSKLMTKTHKPIVDVEESTIDSDTVSDENSLESPEGIIDSLFSQSEAESIEI